MADNYLERQLDLYEAKKAAWEKNKKYKAKKHVQGISSQNITKKATITNPLLKK